jgi:hypothetical protein
MENAFPTFSQVCAAWGENPMKINHDSSAIRAFLIYESSFLRLENMPESWKAEFIDLWLIWERFQFAPANGNPELLACYANRADFDRQKRTSGKPARIIKRAFPWFTEAQCNAFAVWYKEAMTPLAYVVKEGTERKDFAYAYTQEHSRANDWTGNGFQVMPKSLSASCMRYDFGAIHPAEVYASGDFKIVWAEDSAGKIAARCVVYTGNGKYSVAPVYTISDSATKLIESYLLAQGWNGESDSFVGAKLLKLESPLDSNGFVMPYLDNDRGVDDMGDHFQITRHPNIDCRETSGFIRINQTYCQCESCGADIESEDEAYYLESSSSCVCESCYNESTFYCECCNQTHEGQGIEVHNGRTRWSTDTYCESCAIDESTYCENEDEYWVSDRVTYVESESVSVPDMLLEKDYFFSSVDSEYYPNELKVTLPNGNCVTLDQAKESGHWDIEKVTTEKLITTRHGYDHYSVETEYLCVLKVYLELDESGDVVKNQLELPIAA